MAYSTNTPPELISGAPLTGSGKKWIYKSTDAASVVRVSGYFSNARELGMQVGDNVEVHDTDASPYIVTTHVVSAINSTTGAADLSDIGATLGSTNSD
jgi:hypothetical protein